ncbi:MAG TPA: class III signal peptide-containing protein, partial [Hadesarchaea archaeon]|nr:class III signal peptide-containing protein [Hadesarchaea archaeon]
MFRKGQGATEYLLMLAAVLVIVAIAVYYVTSAGPSALISGTAENVGDDIVFTPSTPMT